MATSKYEEAAYVLVFKTNVEYKKDLKVIELCLSELGDINDWHIDREDVDKVLRIESSSDDPEKIIKALTKAGYLCEELTN